MHVQSNGKFPSVEHYVSVDDESIERFTRVNFLDAGPSTHIEGPSKFLDDTHPLLFVPFLASNVISKRSTNRGTSGGEKPLITSAGVSYSSL